MNDCFKKCLKEAVEEQKRKAKKLCNQSKGLATSLFGWYIMLGILPCAAVHIPNTGPTSFFGGLFIVAGFLLGAKFIQEGFASFEEASKEKTVGELFEKLPALPANYKLPVNEYSDPSMF